MSKETSPVNCAVQRYQSEAAAVEPACQGSEVSAVASVLSPWTLPVSPEIA